MKTKNVKEYYTQYMYYYNNYHGYSHNNTTVWEDITPSSQTKWIMSFDVGDGVIPQWMINGPQPVKTRKVINARV